MILKLESNSLPDYLACSDIIDINHRNVIAEASGLARRSNSPLELIQNAYEFVRDGISHSADIDGKTVTCKASEVLQAREGLCYAKSHLLAALLRGNGIPAGFCYQLLRSPQTPDAPPVLHGLTAVFIEKLRKWIRLDARGNKPGIDAQFSLSQERLAYPVSPEKGEIDFAIIFVAPNDNVISTLTAHTQLGGLWHDLPQFPAKMEGCRTIEAERVRQARRSIDPVGYCGHHCRFCFLMQWCGGCRSDYNRCAYAMLRDDNVCPNASCAKDRNLTGCHQCPDLEGCDRGYYEKSGEYIAKASTLFIRKHGKRHYTAALERALIMGINYPETFDSSGSVQNALTLLEKLHQSDSSALPCRSE